LIDRIDRASPELLGHFQDILTKGQIALGGGKNADFKDKVLVFSTPVAREEIRKFVEKTFREDLLNLERHGIVFGTRELHELDHDAVENSVARTAPRFAQG